MLEQFGIERQCCNFDYVSAGEGEKFVRVITEKVGTIKALGPLRLPVPAAKCSPALPDSAFSGSDGNEDSPIAPMKVEPRR
jgi:hypothetical protein